MFILRETLINTNELKGTKMDKENPYDSNFIVTFTFANNVKTIFTDVTQKEMDIIYDNVVPGGKGI